MSHDELGRRPKPPAYTRQRHGRSSEESGWMSSDSKATIPFQGQFLDRKLLLSGTRPLALISGQRKDKEAPGGSHAASRAISAEEAQGAQEERAPEKSQGSRRWRDGSPPLTWPSLLHSAQALAGRRGAVSLPLPGESSRIACLIPRLGICNISLLTGALRRWGGPCKGLEAPREPLGPHSTII